MAAKRYGSTSESPRPDPLQAVLLADSFSKKFRPITLERPKVLLPLVNKPMIDYPLQWLESAGVEQVFVFCSSHSRQIVTYLEQSRWSSKPNFSVIALVASKSSVSSAGDALRFIHQLNVIRGDFVLISGDTLSNMSLTKALQEHRDRKKEDNMAVMTMIKGYKIFTHEVPADSKVSLLEQPTNQDSDEEALHGTTIVACFCENGTVIIASASDSQVTGATVTFRKKLYKFGRMVTGGTGAVLAYEMVLDFCHGLPDDINVTEAVISVRNFMQDAFGMCSHEELGITLIVCGLDENILRLYKVGRGANGKFRNFPHFTSESIGSGGVHAGPIMDQADPEDTFADARQRCVDAVIEGIYLDPHFGGPIQMAVLRVNEFPTLNISEIQMPQVENLLALRHAQV